MSVEEMLPADVDPDSAAKLLAQQGLPEITQQYVLCKISAEAAAAQMTCPVTIIRPGMVAGQGDHNRRLAFYIQRVMDGDLNPFIDTWLRTSSRPASRGPKSGQVG